MPGRLLTFVLHVLKYGVLWGVGRALLGGGIGALRAGHSGALEGMRWAAVALAVTAGLLVATQVRPDQGATRGMMPGGYSGQAPREYQFSGTLIALLACGVCWLVWSALSRYWP